MSNDIEIIKEIIKQECTVELQGGKNQQPYFIELIEKQPETKNNYTLTINNMPVPNQVVVIKTDAFKEPKSIFNNSQNECKRADFVIIANTDIKNIGEIKIILCLEMKKGKGDRQTIIKQLKGAKCFVAYCQAIGKEFWSQPNFLDGYQYYFVGITDISISKQTSYYKKQKKQKESIIHDTPEKMLGLSGENTLDFKHLIKKCQGG